MRLDSESDDLVPIRATVDCPGGGRLITLGAPGLSIDHRGNCWIDPEGIERTVAALTDRKTTLFLVLLRDEDCPAGFRLMLRQQIKRAGIAFAALSIDDFKAPGPAWARAFRRLRARVASSLSGDRSVALCCSFGAGRSGTVATYILCERGLSVDEALFRVRSQFPESIESPHQEAWLHEQFTERESAGHTTGGQSA
ncbi:hypothetical protein [Ensifer sp.]|jgi:hypothetical protein|uniref:protein-tyrosine phosphatase family protein n=1 Tax=Ensifer sp. TaxID=1872086 RepID=UPI002E128B4A|nr:hypothetical protein [Ensifer sp.]